MLITRRMDTEKKMKAYDEGAGRVFGDIANDDVELTGLIDLNLNWLLQYV